MKKVLLLLTLLASSYDISANETEKHEFVCRMCPSAPECSLQYATFASEEALAHHNRQAHTQRRKPIQCAYSSCQKRLPNLCEYKKHLNDHAKIKNKECPKCGKKYTNKSYLTHNHMPKCKGSK